MNTAATSSNAPTKLNQNGISILSLDSLKPNEKLMPGEPHQLASGVTVSVMQSAAEALLEIEESAFGTISVDSHPASELATVRPGQVIKTNEGRYVLVRHLQAIIVPREADYRRPAHVERMIQLAMAGIEIETMLNPETAVENNNKGTSGSILAKFFKKNEGAQELQSPASSNKSKLRLILLTVAVAIVGVLCFLPMGDDKVEVAVPPEVSQHDTKSKVIAAADIAQAGAAAPAAEGPKAPEAKTSEAAQEKGKDKNVSAVDALKGALAPVAQAPKRQKSGAKAVVEDSNREHAVKLSDKDRQTVMEYKLEAKFDRSRARTKLKDFAQSFPAGSPARAEVEKAVNGM